MLDKDQKNILMHRLNDLLKLDKVLMNKILFNRYPCNQNISNHPTVMVHFSSVENTTTTGLDILNGIIAESSNDNTMIITSKYDDNGYATKLELIERK
jgi:hypothetical protein